MTHLKFTSNGVVFPFALAFCSRLLRSPDLCLVHIDICDEMIVIQCNNTEDLLVNELEEMGIPRQQIRLGFLPPEVRSLADDRESQPVLELA